MPNEKFETRAGAGHVVRTLASEVPGSSIAAMGVALAMYLYELSRMSSFQTVADSSNGPRLISGIAAIVASLALGFAYARRPRMRLHRHTALILAIAAVFMATVLATLNASLPVAGTLRSAALHLLPLLLLTFWMEPMLGLSARNAATLFSLSIILLGALNLLTCLLRTTSSPLVVATFPVVSMLCLCWFKDRLEVFYGAGLEHGPSDSPFDIDASLIPTDSTHRGTVSSLYFMQPLVLCPIGYGYIHYSWVSAQDGADASMLIQASAAVGTIAGGLLLLTLISHFWGRRKLAQYNLFTLLVLLFALSLVNLPGIGAPYPYIVFLNVAQKITFFFVFMAPFLIPGTSSLLCMWCLGFALYQLGKLASNAMCYWLDSTPYHALVSLCLFVSAACVVVGTVLDQGSHSYQSESDDEARCTEMAAGYPATPAPSRAEMPAQTAPCPEPAKGAQRSLHSTCHIVARDLMLTRREEDVLILAAQKLAAHEIAEELVIGDSTAKTHLKNLYVKLGVHSRAELDEFLESYGREG